MTTQDDSAGKRADAATHNALVEPSHDALLERLSGGRGRKYTRFVMAALGSIPWVGGLIAAAASLSAEKDQQKISDLQRLWLDEHKGKVQELGNTLNDIFGRLDNFGPEVQESAIERGSVVERSIAEGVDALAVGTCGGAGDACLCFTPL